MRSADRTSESTIRRVGLDGRLENAEDLVAAAVSVPSLQSGTGNRLEYSAAGGRNSQPESEEVPV
jgi:hypothetical protein